MPAHAQKKSSDKDCDKAARIVAKGHPQKKEEDAFATLVGCGATGGNAIASGIAQYTTETDLVALDAFMHQADNWRDSTVMAAMTALAAATPQARVFAVRHLITRVQPSIVYSYAGLTAGNSTTTDAEGTTITTQGCRAQMSSDSGNFVGTPLPSDYVARARQTLASLVAGTSTPTVVRNAARCLP